MSGKLPGRLPPRAIGAPVAPEAPPPTEFDEAEKTPPGVIITAQEVTIVRASARTFVKGVVPHLPALAKYGAIAVGFLAMALQHWAGKAEVEKKVDNASLEAKATTERAYKGLSKPTRDIAAELAALEARVTAAEATSKAQSALLVAREHDFVVEGRPLAKKHRRVDPGLVKAVQANAAKDSKELAVRKATPAPVITPPPLDLPPPPTKNTPQATPPVVGQEWPPSVPVTNADAAP